MYTVAHSVPTHFLRHQHGDGEFSMLHVISEQKETPETRQFKSYRLFSMLNKFIHYRKVLADIDIRKPKLT